MIDAAIWQDGCNDSHAMDARDDQEIEWVEDGDGVDARFANCFRVVCDHNEVTIEFAQYSPQRSRMRPHTRIVTMPEYAGRLLEELQAALRRSGR